MSGKHILHIQRSSTALLQVIVSWVSESGSHACHGFTISWTRTGLTELYFKKYMFEWNLCFSQQWTHYGYGQLVLSTSKPLLSTPLYAQGHEYPEKDTKVYVLNATIHSFLWIFETRLRINECFWPWSAGMTVKPAMDRQLQFRHHNFIVHKITRIFSETTSLLTNTVAHSLPSQHTSPNAVPRLKEPSKLLFHIKTHPRMLVLLTRLCTHRKQSPQNKTGHNFQISILTRNRTYWCNAKYRSTVACVSTFKLWRRRLTSRLLNTWAFQREGAFILAPKKSKTRHNVDHQQ